MEVLFGVDTSYIIPLLVAAVVVLISFKVLSKPSDAKPAYGKPAVPLPFFPKTNMPTFVPKIRKASDEQVKDVDHAEDQQDAEQDDQAEDQKEGVNKTQQPPETVPEVEEFWGRKQQLEKFYHTHEPSKIPEVDTLLTDYKFEDVVVSLLAKYGSLPPEWGEFLPKEHEATVQEKKGTELFELGITSMQVVDHSFPHLAFVVYLCILLSCSPMIGVKRSSSLPRPCSLYLVAPSHCLKEVHQCQIIRFTYCLV